MTSAAPAIDALDATAQAELVRSGIATPSELVAAAIARIERTNPQVNAVITERFEAATAEAAGDLPDGPFRGVPILLKDLGAAMAGEPLHMGTKFLKGSGYRAQIDSYVTARLRRAGFVVLGRTNTPEFGSTCTTEPESYGATRNPWNPNHSSGGSSGGSAAAVAAGMVPVAHASDGGGSIRIPASECGLFGLKPSRGRISRGPLAGEGWGGASTDGCLSITVRDTAAVLDILAGYEAGDPYTAPPLARPLVDEVGADPGRLRIGIATAHPLGHATHPDCLAAVDATAALLQSLGHEVDADARPDAIGEVSFLGPFLTVLNASMRRGLDQGAEMIGREIGPDDVELSNWLGAVSGESVTGAEYLAALDALHAYGRRMCSWWSPAGIRRWVRPPPDADACRTTARTRSPGSRPGRPEHRSGSGHRPHPVHPPVQHQRPAGDVAAAPPQRSRVAHRHTAHRRLRSRRSAAAGGGAARSGGPVGRPSPARHGAVAGRIALAAATRTLIRMGNELPLGLAALAGSAGTLVGSRVAGRTARLVEELPTSSCAGVFMGLNEVTGTIDTPAPSTSPFANVPAVYWSFSVEEEREHTRTVTERDSQGQTRTRTETYTEWHMIDSGSHCHDTFDLVDESGRVQVRPEGAKITPRTTVSEIDDQRIKVGWFRVNAAGGGHGATGRIRRTEEVLAVGDVAFVVGTARLRDDVVAPELAAQQGEPFIVSLRAQEKIRKPLPHRSGRARGAVCSVAHRRIGRRADRCGVGAMGSGAARSGRRTARQRGHLDVGRLQLADPPRPSQRTCAEPVGRPASAPRRARPASSSRWSRPPLRTRRRCSNGSPSCAPGSTAAVPALPTLRATTTDNRRKRCST